ncbi:hypothetical protein S40288_08302 [Stachybotrys chartarum IBT 40288]|nr:hypothetical protein S40288_08302 [Stachybotrys chartarum IBT 40288]
MQGSLANNTSVVHIVVVGDQSSGKSSLLEGLTGLSFPIASDLCTRFATQIVLHRTSGDKTSIQVSIVPGPSSLDDEAQKTRLLEFDVHMDVDDLCGSKFTWILDEAAEYMGLPNSDDEDIENSAKRFSDDILRIEVSGPDQHHLSVVDVPGLFHNPTKYQTREDLSVIRRLIETYTTDARTIILAVMDARNNLANQEVFKMARAADPAGIRTVGIITKCDALQSGDEQNVLKIAQNGVENLQHGWFVVRNRSTKEIQDGVTIAERHDRERKFFRTSPWNELSKDRVGVKALQPFLGQLLYEHIRREFPALIKEIEELYMETQRKLEALGASRQTSSQQRQYLTRLANRYQRNVEDALRGNYSPDLDVKSKLKLRMHLRELADQFEKDIRTKGHTLPFEEADGSVDEDYLDQDLIKEYTCLECRRTEQDDTIRTSLESMVLDQVESTEAYARRQLTEILNDERGGVLQTVNHYFAETLEKIREERVIARLEALGLQDGSKHTLDLGRLTGAIHLSNEDQAVIDIHDVLKAYYKVAIKRFGDYMVISVIERMLGDQGGLKVFSPEYVGSLSDVQLAEMAAENYTTSAARTELEHRCERYRKALQVAKTL